MRILCRTEDLRPGRPVLVALDDLRSAILLRLPTGIAAWQNACPHMGLPLDRDPARIVAPGGRYLRCTVHGALFHPQTGLCVRGPCGGDRLTALPVTEQDGTLLTDAPC